MGLGTGLASALEFVDGLVDTEELSKVVSDVVKVLISLEVEDVVSESEEGAVVDNSSFDDV